MGGAASFNLTFYLFLITLFLILIGPWTLAYAEANDTRETPPPPSPPPDSNGTEKTSSSFKPGIAVVVGVLTTMFSLTFLLLLYIKHCNSVNVDGAGNIGGGGNPSSRGVPPLTGRKNSGIDRCVIESLPIFRFGSLMGQKDGLDCAVCLTKFEATEVLRLLPKCKHAFHVECVDTWLDAHSTCPLCRYRVDPEDILLVEDTKILRQNQPIPPPPQQIHQEEHLDIEKGRNSSQIAETRRVSGRHSSVGEREGGFLQLQIITEREQSQRTASFRRSLDSVTARKKNESVGVGCFVRPRKDGMLLLTQNTDRDKDRDRTSVERRLEHRIIVSPSPKSYTGLHHQHQHQMQRWSDVQPSDLLYLTSEMIIGRRQQQNMQVPLHWNAGGGRRMMMVNNHNNHRTYDDVDEVEEDSWNGRGIINSRSVSEITGLSRFLSVSNNNNNREEEEEGRHHQQGHREERLVSG